ncbi:MAG: hypothetical protein ACMZ64_08430 [Oleiphilus sp.]
MTGCESIHLNNDFADGAKTLFYFSEKPNVSENTLAEFPEERPPLKKQTLNSQNQSVPRSDESDGQVLMIANKRLDQEAKFNESLPEGYVESGFEESDGVDSSLLENEALVAEINALTVSQPSSAGFTSPMKTLTADTSLDLTLQQNVPRTTPQETVFEDHSVLHARIKQAMKHVEVEMLNWHLDRQRVANNHETCRLSSPTIQLDSNQYTTQVWFNIERGQFILNATTHIDPTLPEVGIYLDNGKVEKFLPTQHPSYVSWAGNLNDLLAKNTKLQLVISGSDLKTEVQFASIDLDNLKQMYPKYIACNQAS